MFLEQLFRLIYGIFELGFVFVLLAIFVMGITFIARGYETIGVMMAGGAALFVVSAVKNRE